MFARRFPNVVVEQYLAHDWVRISLNLGYLLGICILSVLYLWVFYHIPVVVAGFKGLLTKNREKARKEESWLSEELPAVSIIVPVKNEENVVGRLLEALLNLNYPPQKREIIIVEDGSTDKTVEICNKYVKQHPNSIKLLLKPASKGKASALNYAFKWAEGDIIALFDADNVPHPDALLKAARSFQNPSISALQGRLCCINANENLFTKIASFEETILFEAYPQGKAALGLSNHLSGSCSFIRRGVIEKIGGWNEGSLTEDHEMSARLLETNRKIKYEPDVRSWQETATSLTEFVKQRKRWYRGCMEVAFKHGNLLKKINKKVVDAEISFSGGYVLNLCLVAYLMYIYILLNPLPNSPVLTIMAQIISVVTVVGLLLGGVVLLCLTKPRKIGNLLLIPLVYAYWGSHLFAALHALVQMVLRRPKEWEKTMKTGAATSVFNKLKTRNASEYR